LLVLDGHNIYIRAYAGLMRQELRTHEGIGTWGVYGTLNTVISMVRRFDPSHILVAFDYGRSSKRTAIDPQYKANRIKDKDKQEPIEEGVDEFRLQFEMVLAVFSMLGIPFLRVKNVEADDIIAKAVTEFSASFEEVIIVSADHDIRQLIRDNVRVVKPSLKQSKDIDEEIFDVQAIREEWGVDPWRLPEIWALMGDKGDNVPGIPGIGPKKATKLIAEHGDLDTVLRQADPKIQDHLDIVRRAYSLIQLDGLDDIPFPPLGSLQFNPMGPGHGTDSLQVESLFDLFEFTNMKEKWLNGTLWTLPPKLGRGLK